MQYIELKETFVFHFRERTLVIVRDSKDFANGRLDDPAADGGFSIAPIEDLHAGILSLSGAIR
jgi:hypothetical protein